MILLCRKAKKKQKTR